MEPERPGLRFHRLTQERLRDELARALHDSRVTLPDLTPLERAEAERVIACTHLAAASVDHEDIAELLRCAERDAVFLARMLLGHLEAPTTESFEELAKVARRVLKEHGHA